MVKRAFIKTGRAIVEHQHPETGMLREQILKHPNFSVLPEKERTSLERRLSYVGDVKAIEILSQLERGSALE